MRRRLLRLLGPALEQSKRLNLRDRVREIEYTLTGSDFESQFLLYRVFRGVFPKTYGKRLRLRPAPLIKLHLKNEYPRASVTRRLGKFLKTEGGAGAVSPAELADPEEGGRDARPSTKEDVYYGPFPSRAAAEKFASDSLDFFKMRRCVEDLHPDPAFPGCVYSEMKMCLAPCFKGCTDDEYHAEVARVQAFLDTRGESFMHELAEQRERASANLAFEEAAIVHARIEKLKPLLSQLPEIVQRIDQLKAVIVQRCAEADSATLFLFAAGTLHGPVLFRIESGGEPQPIESRLRDELNNFPVRPVRSNLERTEHLAILKRWYYRSQRTGEIFFAGKNGEWPLRRIVRGIGRVFKREDAEEFSATQPSAPPSQPA